MRQHRRRSPSEHVEPILQAMRRAGGSVREAAFLLGVSVPQLYGRAQRAGMKLRALKREMAPPDALAGMAREVLRMQRELDDANRIIASLMRELEARAA